MSRWTLWCLAAIVACGQGDTPTSGPVGSRELVIPPREIPLEPGLVDSCELLAEAKPFETLAAPAAEAAVRIDRVCILSGEAGLFSLSLQVELRRPEPIELELGNYPTNVEEFWVAEGTGIDLVGGRREGIEQIEGLGDLAVWYPIDDGMALHAYWDGDTILAVNARGIPVDKGLAWAKGVARSAIAKTRALAAEPGE